mgnify:CR=1 FL=1
MTAREYAEKLADEYPQYRFAYGADDTSVGVWSDEHGRYQVIAGRILGRGDFVGLPYELLVNGKPILPSGGWVALESGVCA